jgi:hypothetical protein
VFTGRRTPYTLRRIPAGVEHVIMLRRKGRAPATRRLRLRRGRTARLTLKLDSKGKPWTSTALVKVESTPRGARVYLNGRAIKKRTPATFKVSLKGSTKLRLVRWKYKPWTRFILPLPNTKLTVLAKLKKRR